MPELDRETVNKILIISTKVLVSTLFVLIVLSVFALEITKKPDAEIDSILEKQREGMRAVLAGKELDKDGTVKEAPNWPPQMNRQYPDLELLDRNGRIFKISDMKGYVLVVSYIDMSSPVSQAQAGAALAGPYGSAQEIDQYAQPFSEAVRKGTGGDFTLPHDSVLELNILVYAPDGSQATLDDATKWGDHFDLELSRGVIVAVPKLDLRGEEVETILGGYQLLDRHMMLRVDSAGREPKHNLTLTLVPLLSKLAR
ncbi:MAG: hypothetical protein ACLFP8_04085 [Alphaproteobacteria bacterium]